VKRSLGEKTKTKEQNKANLTTEHRTKVPGFTFYDQVTCLVDEGKAVDFVYPDFSEAFDTSPQHPPGETSCPWFGWVYSSLDKELTEWPSPQSGGEQS